MNDPPTDVGGIHRFLRRNLFRLERTNPPTSVGGIYNGWNHTYSMSSSAFSERGFPFTRVERYRVRKLTYPELFFKLMPQALGGHQLISTPLRCTIRAKAVAAQDRSARRRLEGH
jgi:hypothetical protein